MAKQTKPSSKKLKLACRELYLSGSEATEITNLTGVPIATIYNWIKSEGWKDQRNTTLQTYINAPEVLMDKFMEVVNNLEDNQTPEELVKTADALAKIVSVFQKLFKDKDRFSQIVFVIRELGTHMNEQDDHTIYDEAFRDKFIKLLSSFQIKAVEKYSNG